MQSGELIITGTDQIVIALNGFPSEVHVKFKNELEVIPCNPHHADTLEYQMVTNNNSPGIFYLKINWAVSSVREVVWHAYY